MASRAPWLEQRRGLIGLAVLDSAVLVAVYNVLFWHQIGRWPGVTGAVTTLVMVWITFSYLFGRYSASAERKTLGSIALVVTIVTLLTVVSVWLGVKGDARTLPKFVLPLLGWSGAISTVIAKAISSRRTDNGKWLLIGNEHELQVASRELERFGNGGPTTIMCTSDQQIQKELSSGARLAGIAISERFRLDNRSIELLLHRRSKGQEITKLTDWVERKLHLMPPELLTREWVVSADGFRLRPGGFSWRLKRVGDLAMASLLLILCSPMILLGAMLIKLEDNGPILYSQIRTGINEETFKIWKLRSMKHESEGNVPQWASKNDARITRVGRILRKLRVDELPQLINVLKGEMSLIGPRPERPELEQQLEAEIEHYRLRHWVRPGLSGWAQVNYCYGASIKDSRIKLSYDLYYLRNFSVWLDVLIVIKTMRLIWNGKGATPST
mgnify:CR=1 FL=1